MFKYGNLARVSVLDPLNRKITLQGYVVSREHSKYGNLYTVQDKFGNNEGPINEILLVPNHNNIKFIPKAIRPGALATIKINATRFFSKDELNPKRYYSITKVLENGRVRLMTTNGKTMDVASCFLKVKK